MVELFVMWAVAAIHTIPTNDWGLKSVVLSCCVSSTTFPSSVVSSSRWLLRPHTLQFRFRSSRNFPGWRHTCFRSLLRRPINSCDLAFFEDHRNFFKRWSQDAIFNEDVRFRWRTWGLQRSGYAITTDLRIRDSSSIRFSVNFQIKRWTMWCWTFCVRVGDEDEPCLDFGFWLMIDVFLWVFGLFRTTVFRSTKYMLCPLQPFCLITWHFAVRVVFNSVVMIILVIRKKMI